MSLRAKNILHSFNVILEFKQKTAKLMGCLPLFNAQTLETIFRNILFAFQTIFVK